MSIVYLSLDEVLIIHEILIERTGGSDGVRDITLVESALARPQQTFGGDALYTTIFEMAAALFESLIGNHAFIDGNKRIASLVALTFIGRNGHRVIASNEELTRMALDAAQGLLSIEELTRWFEENSEPV